MILFAAILFSFSTGCATWVLLHRQHSQNLIAQRINSTAVGNPVASVGGYIDSFLKAVKNKKESITLENMNNDKIQHDLFLAGVYDPKVIRLFHMAIKFSGLLRLLLIGIDACSGHFTWNSALMNMVYGLGIFFYVHLMVRAAKLKRQKQIMRSLPQVLDLVVVCVEAGLGFTASLDRILNEVDQKDPLTKELRLMYYEYMGGLSLSQACERLDKRCEVTDLSLLLTSIIQSDQMGSSLGRTLRTQASEIRDKYKQRMRTKALKIPIKILFPMIAIFMAFMILNFAIIGFQMMKAMGTAQMGAASGVSGIK